LETSVFNAVRAILIGQVRVAFEKADMSLGNLFTNYDKNKDGFLDHLEI
jgi:hypothetical protein